MKAATRERIGYGFIVTGLLFLLALASTDTRAQEAPPPGTIVTISGTTTLEWQAPTENVDGSPLTDLESYNIYTGREPGVYSMTIPVVDGSTTVAGVSITLMDEFDTLWFFAMTAVDSDDNESAFSNEIMKSMTVVFTGDGTPNAPLLIDVRMTFTCSTDNAFWTCDVTWTTGP